MSDTEPVTASKNAGAQSQKKILGQPKVHPEHQDGDVTLISSDGWHFKAHRYQLQAHSPIFLSALEIGQTSKDTLEPKTISLSDPDLESKVVIATYLGLLKTSKLPTNMRGGADLWMNNNLALDLVRFMHKYESEVLQELLRGSLYRILAETKETAIGIFMVAVMLDDPKLCQLAIEKGGSGTWAGIQTAVVSTDTEKSLPGKFVFDVSTWSKHHLEALPIRYLMALLRALHASPPRPGCTWSQAAQTFYATVTAAKDTA